MKQSQIIASFLLGVGLFGSATMGVAKEVSKNKSSPPAEKNPAKLTAKLNGKNQGSLPPNFHLMMRIQQRQQLQTSLDQKLLEKQNILSALESIEKNKNKPTYLQKASFKKDTERQQKRLNERLRVLDTEIQNVQKQLKMKI